MRAKIKVPTAAEERRIQVGIAADPDTFEPTDAQLTAMQPAVSALPPASYAELTTTRRGRGPGKRLAKVLVTVRVDQDVAIGLRASGPGWQVRANEALRRLVEGG